MKPLTRRQAQVLEAIQSFIAEHGYSPSIREIGERIGATSTSTGHRHLLTLRRKGYVAWDEGAKHSGKPRTLRVLNHG